MRPKDWFIAILKRNGLERPDGRPLYQYRVADDEFLQLIELLKLSALMGVVNISQMASWNAVFVMYAAEWWRRFYDGKWGWDGIFASVGLRTDDLPVTLRNELIELGLRQWRRDVRIRSSKRKFLGTIATEGGLPLHQLSESGGWLKNLLQPVLKKHLTRGIGVETLVDNYGDCIPGSYRSEELKDVLADIVKAVVDLREKYQLAEKSEPVKWLEQYHADWRSYFPIPIDDAAGKALLSELIDTAARTKKEVTADELFEVEYTLVRAESMAPGLCSQIDVPDFVFLKTLNALAFRDSWPAKVDISVFAPDGRSWNLCRAIQTVYRGESAFRLIASTLRLTGIDATVGLRLRFKALGETLAEADMTMGDGLDTGLPWMFRLADGKWILHGVASQSVQDHEALIYLPDDCVCEPYDDKTTVCELGRLLKGMLLKVSGNIRCRSEGALYKLTAGGDESVNVYHLTGKRTDYCTSPQDTFIGLPGLQSKNVVNGYQQRVQGHKLLIKPFGEKTQWRPMTGELFGCYELRLFGADNEVLFRKKIGILPERFSVTFNADNHNVCAGTIHFSGISDAILSVSTKDIVGRCLQDKASAILSVNATETPPLSVDVSFLPQERARELSLILPFPSKGALLFNAEGERIDFKRRLYLSNLFGYRIKLMDNNYHTNKKALLIFLLSDTNIERDELRDMYIRHDLSLSGQISEFSIMDWVPQICALMGVSSSLDAHVKVSLEVDGQEQFSFKVLRYEMEFTQQWGAGTVELNNKISAKLTLEDIDNIGVSVLPLRQPEQNCDDLKQIKSQEAPMGVWPFTPEKRPDGPWLIYPAANSVIMFRPMLWVVGHAVSEPEGGENKILSLPQAIVIGNSVDRELAICVVLKEMALDFSHKGWRYLEALWEKTQHLPMASLDLWRVAVNNSIFLASLLIKYQAELIEKIESELPLVWELTRLSEWKDALVSYKRHIKNLDLDDDTASLVLEKKIGLIEKKSTSLISLGQLLRADLLGKTSLELRFMREPAVQVLTPFLSEQLQNLLRRKSDAQWPQMLSAHINSYAYKLPESIRTLIGVPHKFQRSVVLLPFVLAWRSLTTDCDDWRMTAADKFKIQQIQQFDEDWFKDTYNYLFAWLSQQNLKELN